MALIFDIGMFDGEDTAYYIEDGNTVVAVEANPRYVALAASRFAEAIAAGRLHCVHAAISPDGQPVTLTQSVRDPASSSTDASRVSVEEIAGSVTVPGVALESLFETHGIPQYLKVDIEGADRFCILPLSSAMRPPFVSFEIGDDALELTEHLAQIGYSSFQIVSQPHFRAYPHVWPLTDRIANRVITTLGYREPAYIRRAGRFFRRVGSSGPLPWKYNGHWQPMRQATAMIEQLNADPRAQGLWFDLHARAD